MDRVRIGGRGGRRGEGVEGWREGIMSQASGNNH